MATLTLVFCVAGCSGSSQESTVLQRQTSQTSLEGDISLAITSGTFRITRPTSAVARSASPIARLRVTGGPKAEGRAEVQVFNIHPESILEVVSVQFPTDGEVAGCSILDRPPIPCRDSKTSIGNPCGGPTDCPTGLACINNACAPSTAYERLCVLPEWSVDTNDPTAFNIVIEPSTCTSYDYGLAPPQGTFDTVTFGVLGSTESLEKLRRAMNGMTLARDLDFVAVLGENLENNDQQGVDAMDNVLRSFGVPVNYVAGEDAVGVDSGSYVVRRLGPHEFAFDLGPARFASFFSATRDLGENGILRLENILRQGSRSGTGPYFAFTHTPPLDPNGLRDLGFRSRIEGAQAMSLLNQFEVNYLFAGRINGSDQETIGPTQVFITSAEDSISRSASEYLIVRVNSDGSGDRQIGGAGVTVTIHQF